jgi:hypothetical protein
MEVTSLEALKSYSMGQLVELPPFAEGQTFVARLKRPSMLALVKAGRIPNSLLQSANTLFISGTMDEKNKGAMSDVMEILDTVCDACFVEPTYQQIKDAGIQLTDDQMMFVFSYSQRGVKALDPFRQEPKDLAAAGSGTEV